MSGGNAPGGGGKSGPRPMVGAEDAQARQAKFDMAKLLEGFRSGGGGGSYGQGDTVTIMNLLSKLTGGAGGAAALGMMGVMDPQNPSDSSDQYGMAQRLLQMALEPQQRVEQSEARIAEARAAQAEAALKPRTVKAGGSAGPQLITDGIDDLRDAERREWYDERNQKLDLRLREQEVYRNDRQEGGYDVQEDRAARAFDLLTQILKKRLGSKAGGLF